MQSIKSQGMYTEEKAIELLKRMDYEKRRLDCTAYRDRNLKGRFSAE